MPHFERLLLTGAAGRLGRLLREKLAPLTAKLRVLDRADLGHAATHEEIVQAELADFGAVLRAAEGSDAIVHFGSMAEERPWAEIRDAIEGSYNLYEAARRSGVKRVVFSSSIHAMGAMPLDADIGVEAVHRPDSLYGLSKCFTEDLAKLYWDKFGIESVCLRIGFCYRFPTNRERLSTWLSPGDMCRYVRACLVAERVGFTVAYGVSGNGAALVSNRGVEHLRLRPVHDAEVFRELVERTLPPRQADEPEARFLGGDFFKLGHPDDPDATG